MLIKQIIIFAYNGVRFFLFIGGFVLIPVQAIAGDCFSHANECSEAQLCILATTNSGSVKKWTNDSDYSAYVRRAKELGKNCGLDIFSPYCQKDPHACSREELCQKAVTFNNGVLTWKTTKKALIYLEIARSKNFSCGVIDKKREVFSQIIREVQKELNRVGCGAGAADGILGKKTLRAIELYRNQAGVQFDLPKVKDSLFFNKIHKTLTAENTMKNCLQITKIKSGAKKPSTQSLKETLNDVTGVKDSIFKLLENTVKCAVHLVLLDPLCSDGSASN